MLATAAASGTLAAVRELTRAGIEVRVLSHEPLDVARWSRYPSRVYRAPSEKSGDAFLRRLVEIGASTPGQVLIPTSDETAWLYATHADLLQRYYRLQLPSPSVMRKILDKKAFAEATRAAKLPSLAAWDPADETELAALAPRLPYPILLKPRTHVNRHRTDKGVVVDWADDLIRQYRAFTTRERKATRAPAFCDTHTPLLQQFVPVGSEGIRSVTGFIDRSGQMFVTRHSRKVFLRSAPVGIGLCFESLPDDEGLSQAVYVLCRELGYFGIFEVEFILAGGQWCPIDFNPRLFNQVALDIRRGFPLPLFAYLDAAGDRQALQAAIGRLQSNPAPSVLYDKFTLAAMLLVQRLASPKSREHHRSWKAWTRRNAPHAADIVFDRSDKLPGIAHAFSEIALGIKSFSRFMRMPARVYGVAPNALFEAEA